MSVIKRGGIGVIVLTVCIVIVLSMYWTIQRIEVRRAAQIGLNTTFHTPIHINEVELGAIGSVSKWIVLPFRRHYWFVIYRFPQGGTSMGIVGQNQHGNWVYERIMPHGLMKK